LLVDLVFLFSPLPPIIFGCPTHHPGPRTHTYTGDNRRGRGGHGLFVCLFVWLIGWLVGWLVSWLFLYHSLVGLPVGLVSLFPLTSTHHFCPSQPPTTQDRTVYACARTHFLMRTHTNFPTPCDTNPDPRPHFHPPPRTTLPTNPRVYCCWSSCYHSSSCVISTKHHSSPVTLTLTLNPNPNSSQPPTP